MVGPSVAAWSRAAARRLGERSLLSDSGSKLYTLLIGMCVIRAAISAYFALTLSLPAAVRGELAVLQLGVSGATFSALAGLQAARYARRIDALLFTDAPAFPRFRRLLGRRFLFERPFVLAGGSCVAALGAIACLIDGRGTTILSVLAAAAATLGLTVSVYRWAPSGTIGKRGFKIELAVAAVSVLANPDLLNDGRRVTSNLFFSATPQHLLETRPRYVLLVYLIVALGLAVWFAIEAGLEVLAPALRRKAGRPRKAWTMPLAQAGGAYWVAVWALAYVIYAFCGRKPAAMVLAATALAVVGGIARVVAFLASCAQRLGDDGSDHFPARYWLAATVLAAAPHLLPCAILAFVE